MHVNAKTQLAVLGGMLALAVAAGACSSNASKDTRGTSGAAGATGDRASAAPVSLTGCLQKSSGMMSDFVLTEVNSQPQSVGTSGSAGTPGSDTVGREQNAAAAKSYRLDGDNDQLNNLVGKQVRVSGRISDRGDLATTTTGGAANPSSNGTAGQTPGSSAQPDRDINASNLARVHVDSIDQVSDSCGSGSASPR